MIQADQRPSNEVADIPRTVAVTVTYGSRKNLLLAVLEDLREFGLSRVIVVNNGALWDVHSELSVLYQDFVDVIDLGSNSGSANGYACGIQRACSSGADYVWLLDDDNRPDSTTLPLLHDALAREATRGGLDQTAVVAFRPEHQGDVAEGVDQYRVNPRRSSFAGFHVIDIWYKVWRRTPWGRPCVTNRLPRSVQLDAAPYSGLLLHRSLIERIGLPRSDFVLYADDTEYSYRITRAGGSIFLITDALIEDLESSWNIKQRFGNIFTVMLQGAGDFRAFYGMRNRTFFDAHYLRANVLIFWLNRQVFMAILYVLARLTGRMQRYRLLAAAVSDGLSGRLGLHSKFLL